MVRKRGNQELETSIDETIEEVTETPKQTRGIKFTANGGSTKLQDRECFFCSETEKPFFAIVKISDSGVN